MQIITIKNDYLQVSVSTLGAELQSVILNGKELIWQGDKNFWRGKAPILFPIAGALKDKQYYLNGVLYDMPFHGFARNNYFSVEQSDESSVTFKLSSTEETKKYYPFEFDFYVTYTIENNSLQTVYKVVNKCEKEMFFGIGSHESYNFYGTLSECELHFEKEEKFLSNIVTDGALILSECDDFGPPSSILKISKDLFIHDTAVFANVNSRMVTLKKNGKKIASVEFDAPNLLLWSKAGAPFICIEPWLNLPSFASADKDIKNKPGLIWLKGGQVYENRHSITYFNDWE